MLVSLSVTGLLQPRELSPTMKIIVHMTNRLMDQAIKCLLTVHGYGQVSLDLHAFLRPDVIVVDVLTIGDTAALYPRTKLLLLNIGIENKQMIEDLPSYRLCGILSPQAGVSAFQQALRTIRKDRIFTDEHGLGTVPNPKAVPKTARPYGITKREQQIIDLVVQGSSNKQIGDRLAIAENTVKSHLHTIFQKYHATSRKELIRLALNKTQIKARRGGRTTKSALARAVRSSPSALDRPG